MPRLDGLSFLRRLMEHHPLPAIIVSSLTQSGSAATIEALRIGAVDVIAKPGGPHSVGQIAERLKQRIRAAAGVRLSLDRKPAPTEAIPARSLDGAARRARGLVAIGASTGGTQALETLLTRLPADVPPILIVQHMPAGFTASLASRLDSAGALAVREARTGDVLDPGTILVAPGGTHLRISDDRRLRLSDDAPAGGLKPRADFTIADAARLFGRRMLLVVLTGMGKDGLDGAREVRRQGGRILVEAEETCTVYGMPRAVVDAGLADSVLALGELAPAVAELAGVRA
jgi:two-component system, chemotaxis family, protein-glutamate methylesterase/glutaminase